MDTKFEPPLQVEPLDALNAASRPHLDKCGSLEQLYNALNLKRDAPVGACNGSTKDGSTLVSTIVPL